MGIERVADSHSPLTITSHNTRVVQDAAGAAVITRLPTTAQQGGPARGNRPQRRGLDAGESVRATVRLTMRAHEVAQGQADRGDGRRCSRGDGTHGLRLRGIEPGQQIERGPGRDLRMPRQLEVPRGRREVAVPQQALNRMEVDAGFQ